MKSGTIGQLLPKMGSAILMIAVILGTVSWLKPEPPVASQQSHPEVMKYELVQRNEIAAKTDERPEKSPCEGRGRHHGPPHPPGIPPTVLFLIGGALGYLIGSQRKGPRFPPPPPRRHHSEQ